MAHYPKQLTNKHKASLLDSARPHVQLFVDEKLKNISRFLKIDRNNPESPSFWLVFLVAIFWSILVIYIAQNQNKTRKRKKLKCQQPNFSAVKRLICLKSNFCL
jgi:hypothetical protein